MAAKLSRQLLDTIELKRAALYRPMPDRLLIAVYAMSNRRNGTLYIGVTSNLPRRAWEHREGLIEGFTKKYGLKRLVWYEEHRSIAAAIQRETNLKKYKRDWKINLIERENRFWIDLYPALVRRGQR